MAGHHAMRLGVRSTPVASRIAAEIGVTDKTADIDGRLWHRRGALGVIGTAAALVGGCVASPFGGGAGDGWGARPVAPDAPPPAVAGGPLTGDVIGGGGTRIGLILPMSATGNAGAVARSMRLAAELAYGDVAGNDLAVIVRDDRGTPEGAQAAATELVQAGAQLVLGPLISTNVVAAAGVLRPANVPLIAFSTDEAVAAPGVHLLSFLPSNDVNRMVDYCASQGRRAFVALFPQDPYGQVAEAALMPALSRVGARAVAVERYPLDRVQMIEPVQRVIPALAQADVLFIADGADASALVLENLRGARGSMARVKIAGTGRWDDPRILQNQAFAGAWYTGPDANGFRTFAQRYRARFNADPARTASLSYDATLLAAALSTRGQAGARFAPSVLTNPNGFAGVDGLFRFLPNGRNQRGIAVLEVRNGAAVAVSPAPASFAGMS